MLYGREPGIISAAEESTAWPGVSRPTYLGGLGLRLQVEHGLDARHARLLPAGPDLPPLPPPRADVHADVRVQRELHPAAVPRRGRARQGLAVLEDAGRPLAEARQPARAVRLHVGAPRQEAAVHGRRVRAGGASGATSARSTGTCSSAPSTPGSRRWSATSTALYRDEPALWEVDSDPSGFWWIEPNDADANVVAFARQSKDGERVVVFVANLSPVPREDYRLGLPRACRWREAINTDSTYYGGSDVGNLGGVEPEPIPWHGQPVSAERHAAAARGGLAGPGHRVVGAEYPWERPLGARPLGRRPRRVPRLGAARGARDAAARRTRSCRWTTAGYGVYEVVAPARRRGRLPVRARWPGSSPIRARACSRTGCAGPSRVLAPTPPPAPRGSALASTELVIYELHVGTFSAEGTFDGAIPYLPDLAELGVNAIEIMPVAEFPGARGWGYDGVYIERGAVVLRRTARPARAGRGRARRRARGDPRRRLQPRRRLGRQGARGVRAVLHRRRTRRRGDGRSTTTTPTATRCASGCCRAPPAGSRDFGIDGLRLDAIHAIFDSSPEHIVAAVARRVRQVREDALVIAESGLNDPRVMRPRERGGYACDAEWADDFHHALRTLVTDERDGYYADFGPVAQLAKAYDRPHVRDGGYSKFLRRRFGAPADDVPRERFVVFSQNHDQVGNRAFGDRLPMRGPAAGRVLHAALAVRAAAVHGRGVRRAGPVPVLLRPHRPGDRGGDPRGAPRRSSRRSRSSPARRSPTRRTWRRSSARS